LPHLKNQSEVIIPLEGGIEVRLSMQARREIIYEASDGYDKLSKKERLKRLDYLVAVTG